MFATMGSDAKLLAVSRHLFFFRDNVFLMWLMFIISIYSKTCLKRNLKGP